MNYYSPEPNRRALLFGGGLSSAVRMLLAWNVILFLLQQIVHRTVWVPMEGVMVPRDVIEYYFGLCSDNAIGRGWIWQFVTYMFLHGGVLHILFNMLALWMFGSELEGLWGTARFVRFYFFTGIGAGLASALLSPHVTTIGASGAIYGLLLAYGLTYPNRPILLYFLFPIPAKYFVILFGALELLASFSGSASGIAHFAHLGGLLFGWLYLRPPGLRWYRRRQRERQMRKFKVVDFRDRDERR